MRHKRKRGGGEASGVQMGLIITPMLDMSFQLMAFFIMTYHPSAFEGHVNGNLVPPERSKAVAANQLLKDDVLPNDEHYRTASCRSRGLPNRGCASVVRLDVRANF